MGLRSRAVGIRLLALSVAVIAIAVGLSLLGHVSPLVQAIPFAFGIPTLYLSWKGLPGGGTDPRARAEDLARWVRNQWEKELQVRQLNGADIMSIRWDAAPADLVESWPALVRIARETPGARDEFEGLERRPPLMSGSGGRLGDTLKRVPTGRLVVLGEPGSGKTILLIRMVLDLLATRKPRSPVPVLIPLASWDPEAQSLRAWLISRLVLDYRPLRNTSKTSTSPCSLAEAMIDQHLLLLIFDGLDELKPEFHLKAVGEINDLIPRGVGVVVACREAEYRALVHPDSTPGPSRKLYGAAGIRLCPLDEETVKDYLWRGDGENSPEARRWDPLLRTVAQPESEVAAAFRTPLVVSAARGVYAPWPGERKSAKPLPEPDELCDLKRFPDSQAIRTYLFRTLIRAAYRLREDPRKNRWTADDAELWLGFLANHLKRKGEKYNILAWWEIRDAAPPWLVPAVIGTVCGLAGGIAAGIGSHVGFGIGIGLGVGAFTGLPFGLWIRSKSEKKGSPATGIAGALVGALAGGFVGALAGRLGIGHAVWPFGGLAVSLAVAIGVGSSTNFRGGLAGGLAGALAAALLEGVGAGAPAGVMNGAGMGLCAAFAVAYVGRTMPAFQLRWRWPGAVCGLAIGTAVGLITSRAAGWHAGVLLGSVIGMISAWPCGLSARNQSGEAAERASTPRSGLVHDYRTFWKTAPAAGIAAIAAGLIGGGLTSVSAVKGHVDISDVVRDGLAIGIAAGIIIGLAFGLYHSASGFFVIARIWLALRGSVPRPRRG